MKLFFSRKVFFQLDDESRAHLMPIKCPSCERDRDPRCEDCDGSGTVYVQELDRHTADAIIENFARQGVTIGKAN